MSPPIRVANEPRSFAPKLAPATTSAPEGAVWSEAVGKAPRLMRFGDLRHNLATPRKLDDR